ncbi:hypothetical protein PHYBLDRAFT_152717 [Phycomyces blakesleeanus NRRL 1555(-)]|uniref:Uncharacterized protein n=1 Tax=Phycomyces blakesleeanus (strain ATCC 8743b / DSM 1359 / FGSC 10004 / NBRC 33097 / NRRL 1555) TaxID=763407 RepID=A0A163CWP0_PHYB8|nr:hypothetical protein PHYBLDRAFT_152717 [Phycomyces blakesleeanus NRRL 1555(-)]OAD66150.1 hypothetical protein PHYBLDRAFT_152717 [Phycomyces blakesleeanus NRRL 1555(-)]|eukprot:XP_018284190.1 hypothetical protein PHYBLDRAFT_152717 [Phycomyces blakesleeanus NRRL 1555(-)]
MLSCKHDNIIKSLLLAIQLQLSVLHASQKQIKMDINSLGNEIMIKGSPKQNLSLFINTSSEFIFKSVINIRNVTLEHVYQMMSQHLGIKVTASKKATLRTCTKLVCNELATLPSVQAFGPRPNAIKIGHPLQESVISGKIIKGGNCK